MAEQNKLKQNDYSNTFFNHLFTYLRFSRYISLCTLRKYNVIQKVNKFRWYVAISLNSIYCRAMKPTTFDSVTLFVQYIHYMYIGKYFQEVHKISL